VRARGNVLRVWSKRLEEPLHVWSLWKAQSEFPHSGIVFQVRNQVGMMLQQLTRGYESVKTTQQMLVRCQCAVCKEFIANHGCQGGFPRGTIRTLPRQVNGTLTMNRVSLRPSACQSTASNGKGN